MATVVEGDPKAPFSIATAPRLFLCLIGKMDYTPETPVVTDEWELDPDKLKFSTPLGQGAFGKVVTGYYDQRKVAIKVVKGPYIIFLIFRVTFSFSFSLVFFSLFFPF